MNLIINTDGASRGNPGQASYGFVICDDKGKILYEEGQTIGIATNNVAEYQAVLSALEYIRRVWDKDAPHNIEVITDSQLIASQLSGKYKIKNQNLKGLFDKIKILEFDLGNISYRNVPRSQNIQADKLANRALDEERG